jgi:hypothetical protein
LFPYYVSGRLGPDSWFHKIGSSTFKHKMSARQNFKDTWKIENLETSRKHLVDHPLTSQYSLHSDPEKISPTWNKVSTTPWQGRSDLTGGYGRRIMKSSISCDAPTSFLNPERTMGAQKYDPIKMKAKIPNESSYVLPGGRSLQVYQRPPDKSRFNTMPFRNETIMEPLATPRTPPAPIPWGPLPKEGPRAYF